MLSTSQTTSRTTAFDSAIADRLYRVADALAYDWRESGLSDGFASAIIVAVVQFLQKTGLRRTDGSRRTPAEQVDFAEALLRRFWDMNARRDAARRSEARERGTRPDVLPLELVGEQAGIAHLHDPLRDDLLAGETGRTVARFLEGRGWSRERAWAFVWRESGREWDDVAFLLSERFEVDATPGCLRKWGERYFEPAMPYVRAYLEGRSTDLSRAENTVSIQAMEAAGKGR